MIARILPPPAVPPGLPRGTEAGGIFEVPYAPANFGGAGYAPLPFDASTPQPIPPSTAGRAMPITSILPQAVGAYAAELADQMPTPIGPYHPARLPSRGGIFAGMGSGPGGIFSPGVGQIERMAMSRPEWTRWQVAGAAARRRAIDKAFATSGLGGCGCGCPMP